MLAQGITVPHIKVGRLSGLITVEKGRATLKDFRAHSPDLDLQVDGYVELRDPLSFSVLHLYVRFKPSEALAKREPTIELLNNVLSGTAKRADGFFGLSLLGTLASPLPNVTKDAPPGILAGGSGSVSVSAVHTAPSPPMPHFGSPVPSVVAPSAPAPAPEPPRRLRPRPLRPPLRLLPGRPRRRSRHRAPCRRCRASVPPRSVPRRARPREARRPARRQARMAIARSTRSPSTSRRRRRRPRLRSSPPVAPDQTDRP